jgi:uncharacterized RDD family membrane protein YckC
VAATLDTVVLFGLSSAVLLVLQEHPLWKRTGSAGVLLRVVVACVVASIYYGVWMTRTNGQTPGKRIARIRVARIDGRPMTFARAVWREAILKIALLDLAGLIAGGAVGFAGLAGALDVLWSAGNPQRRTLHDLASGTRVILDDVLAPK